MTLDITRAVTFEHLHNALHAYDAGSVVWTLDANGDLQTAHRRPAGRVPCVVLDTLTGIVYLYHGAAFIKRLAKLTRVKQGA